MGPDGPVHKLLDADSCASWLAQRPASSFVHLVAEPAAFGFSVSRAEPPHDRLDLLLRHLSALLFTAVQNIEHPAQDSPGSRVVSPFFVSGDLRRHGKDLAISFLIALHDRTKTEAPFHSLARQRSELFADSWAAGKELHQGLG
jgi:hypothetical protein